MRPEATSPEVYRGVKATLYATIPWWVLRPLVISPSLWIHVTMSSVISAPCPYMCLLAPVTALGWYRNLLFWTSPQPMEALHTPIFLQNLNQYILLR